MSGFVSVEQLVRVFLRSHVDHPVEILVPNERPERFIRVFRTGGRAINQVLDAPQVTVQAWALDRYDAERDASACRSALLSQYTQMPLVRGVSETGGLYFNPDPESGVPRYQFTVTVMTRARR